jgi:hypothetical protein
MEPKGGHKMATPRKATSTRKKSAPKSAAQIHRDRVTEKSQAEVASEPTSVEEWKARSAGRALLLPSGFTAMVRNPGLGMFVEKGMIPNSLMPIVMAALDEGKPPSKRMLKDMSRDPDAIADIAKLARDVTVACVIKPKIHPVPEDGDRDNSLLYSDEVDLDDCMFIFQWVIGGTHDLNSFREEQESLVADLSGGSDME